MALKKNRCVHGGWAAAKRDKHWIYVTQAKAAPKGGFWYQPELWPTFKPLPMR